MYINTFQYTPEDVDCKLCTEYAGEKRGCTAAHCPWLAERIEAGTVGYQEAIMETFHDSSHLQARLHRIIRHFNGSLYLTAAHQQRMDNLRKRLGYRRGRDSPAYYAAMYLLTANEELYNHAANCFCRFGIEFGYAALQGMTPHNYTLFSAARDIYADASGVTLADLANSVVVDTLAFSLIVNAALIARYGCAVLKIKEKEVQL